MIYRFFYNDRDNTLTKDPVHKKRQAEIKALLDKALASIMKRLVRIPSGRIDVVYDLNKIYSITDVNFPQDFHNQVQAAVSVLITAQDN